jgi:hypothetical protein
MVASSLSSPIAINSGSTYSINVDDWTCARFRSTGELYIQCTDVNGNSTMQFPEIPNIPNIYILTNTSTLSFINNGVSAVTLYLVGC